MTTGKENYQTLRAMYRHAGYRRFGTKHRTNRRATILGMGPSGKFIGWFDGSTNLTAFDPDEISWTAQAIYIGN